MAESLRLEEPLHVLSENRFATLSSHRFDSESVGRSMTAENLLIYLGNQDDCFRTPFGPGFSAN
jgi:hypothetical protein